MSAWSEWGTKLNVTSIVSQGLEQVRSLREDVEKSFDEVVMGAPAVHLPLPLRVSGQTSPDEIPHETDGTKTGNAQIEVSIAKSCQLEDKSVDMEADNMEGENKTSHTETEKIQLETHQVILDGDAALTEDCKENVEAKANAIVKTKDYRSEDTTEIIAMEQEERAHELKDAINQKEQEKAHNKQNQEDADRKDEKTEEKAEDEEEKEEMPEVVACHVEDIEHSVGESVADNKIEEGFESMASDDVSILRKELAMRESQLLATSTTIQELHDELDKTCHREVAAVERAHFLTDQLEIMRHEVTKLTQLHRDTSSSQTADVQALEVALVEKEEKLSALLNEGQVLSVKQAQLEQRLRTLRKEKDEVEERALKLQSQLEASIQATKELSTKLKSCEDAKTQLAVEKEQLTDSAGKMKARVEKTEQEAQGAIRQLETLQTLVEQLTQDVTSKTDEVDKLKTLSKWNEALACEKEKLQQTLFFLQDTVRDLEQDAARRDEMARAEITDLKRKWQAAVARVDLLGQSVSEATQPLLDQIHALQEEQRAKQARWKATETALLGRIEEASEQRRGIELEKLDMEQLVHGLEQKAKESEVDQTRRQTELDHALEAEESARARAQNLRGEMDALLIAFSQVKHQCDAEVAAKEKLQARLDHAEKDSMTSATAIAELEHVREHEAQLQQDLEWHRQELHRLKHSFAMVAPLSTGSSSLQRCHEARRVDGEDCESFEAPILKTTLKASDSIYVNHGNTTVLGLSQLQQRLRLREGENRRLKHQLEESEARQKQTTDEIVRLSTRNALLESSEVLREQTQLQLAKLQKHQVVLLELFGEKEEQVEELQAEVSELKAFYRKQLDSLATHNAHNEQQREKLRDH